MVVPGKQAQQINGAVALAKSSARPCKPRSALHPNRCCPCRGGKDLPWDLTSGSPLLDLRAAKGGVDALVHETPIDLVKHLIDVCRLRAEERTLAEGRRLEELDGQTAGAHLRDRLGIKRLDVCVTDLILAAPR